VPLISQNQVIGMISLTRLEPNAFGPDDINSVLAFAGQAAIALENARLYEHIIRFNDQLEQMVDQRTQELNQAYNNLEKLDQTKSDFIRVSAHELRTPLTVIKGYAQLLAINPVLKDQTSITPIVGEIVSGVDRLNQIVNSMLDVAKIDSDTLAVHPEKVVLGFVIEQIYNKFEPDLKARRLDLTCSGLDDLPPLHADPDLLPKVFNNLVGNAIKYTPNGGHICIKGQVIAEADRRSPYVEVVVSDTGIGIDPEHHEIIFEKFYQTGELMLHSSGMTKFKGGGPGLGLAIAQGIVLAHRGQIWVESPGYDEETCPGSDFYVRLPLE
jgi:signal transduction histidine kinase